RSSGAAATPVPGELLGPGHPIERDLRAVHQSVIERTPIDLTHRLIRVLLGEDQRDDGGLLGRRQCRWLLPLSLRDRIGDRPIVPVVVGPPVIARPGDPHERTSPGDRHSRLGQFGDDVGQDNALRSSHSAYSRALINAGGISVVSSVEVLWIPCKSSNAFPRISTAASLWATLSRRRSFSRRS